MDKIDFASGRIESNRNETRRYGCRSSPDNTEEATYRLAAHSLTAHKIFDQNARPEWWMRMAVTQLKRNVVKVGQKWNWLPNLWWGWANQYIWIGQMCVTAVTYGNAGWCCCFGGKLSVALGRIGTYSLTFNRPIDSEMWFSRSDKINSRVAFFLAILNVVKCLEYHAYIFFLMINIR